MLYLHVPNCIKQAPENEAEKWLSSLCFNSLCSFQFVRFSPADRKRQTSKCRPRWQQSTRDDTLEEEEWDWTAVLGSFFVWRCLGLVWDFFGGWGGDIGKLHWENIRPWWGQPSRSLFVHANTATVSRPLVEDTHTASWSSAGRQIEQKDCKRECLSGLVLLSIEHSISHSVI